LLLALVVGVLVLASTFNIGDRIAQLRGWIDSLGALGLLVYTLIYIIAVVAAIPGSPITVLAGALFGSVIGVIVVSIGSTIGAGLAFLIGRYFARDAVARWLKDKEKFKKLDRLTEEHGSIIVAITRLVPVFPFNVLNYGFGLTRVKFWTYVFWSWLCMLPGTILYVVGADAVTKGLAQGRVPWALIGVIASVIIILTLLVRQARKQLNEKEQAVETNP
ncbi:MAG: TVP38/TMEM64 family protein, partial [Candidatus Marinimicrobia bacterium]|nr:TVP38/TMEM64 family protein [Candidatus Neomarinimicrobiota bacterium]